MLRLEGLDDEMLSHLLTSTREADAPSQLRELSLARGTFERLQLPAVSILLSAPQ